MKNFYFSIFFLILISACKNTGKDPTITGFAKLTFESIYSVDSIRVSLNTSSSLDSEEAIKQYVEAVNLFQQNQIDQSIQTFKSSICLYPSAQTYFNLGNALIAIKNFDEGLKAFHIAELMNYSPIAEIMFKIAGVYSVMRDGKLSSDGTIKYNDSLALHYMEIALQMGYNKPIDFLRNKVFDSLRLMNEWQFKTIYQTAQ